ADRGGRHGGQVRPDAGLGHGDRRDQLTGRDAGQPALLLLVGAVGQEVRHGDVVVQREAEAGGGRPGPDRLLAEHGVEAEVVDATAAVLLGNGHAEEPVAAGDLEQLPRDYLVLVPLVD